MKTYSDEQYAAIIDGKAHAKVLKKELLNSRRRSMRRKLRKENLRQLSRAEWVKHQQFLLWHKLHAVFSKVEYVSYESLPEALQQQVQPFPEFVIDRVGNWEVV